jgi:hypothetical protein
MNKRIKSIIIIIVLILGTLSASFYFMPFGYRMAILMGVGSLWTLYVEDEKMLSESKFDKTLWMEAGSKDYWISDKHRSNCTRGKMSYDLKKNYLVKNMPKEEVFSLLGKPEYGLKYPNNIKHQYCLEYELGRCTNWVSGPGKILLVCLKKDKLVDVFVDSGNNDAESFKID